MSNAKPAFKSAGQLCRTFAEPLSRLRWIPVSPRHSSPSDACELQKPSLPVGSFLLLVGIEATAEVLDVSLRSCIFSSHKERTRTHCKGGCGHELIAHPAAALGSHTWTLPPPHNWYGPPLAPGVAYRYHLYSTPLRTCDYGRPLVRNQLVV